MDPAYANTSSKDVERTSDPLSSLAAAAADRNLAIIHVSANAIASNVLQHRISDLVPASSLSLDSPPPVRNTSIDDEGAVIDHEPLNLPASPTASRASSPPTTNDQPHGAIVGSLHALPPPPLPIMTDHTGLISSQHNDHWSNDTQKGTEEKEVSTITRTDGNEKPAAIQLPDNEGYPATATKKSTILEPPTSLKAESGNSTNFELEKLVPPQQRISNESTSTCNPAASNSADADADEGASSSSLLTTRQESQDGHATPSPSVSAGLMGKHELETRAAGMPVREQLVGGGGRISLSTSARPEPIVGSRSGETPHEVAAGTGSDVAHTAEEQEKATQDVHGQPLQMLQVQCNTSHPSSALTEHKEEERGGYHSPTQHMSGISSEDVKEAQDLTLDDLPVSCECRETLLMPADQTTQHSSRLVPNQPEEAKLLSRGAERIAGGPEGIPPGEARTSGIPHITSGIPHMQIQEQKLQGAGAHQASSEGGNKPTPHIDPRAKVGRSETRNQVGQQQRPPIGLEKLTTTAGKQTTTAVTGKRKSDGVVAASRPLQLGERRSASRTVPTSSCGMVGITRAANPGKQSAAGARGTVRQLHSSSTSMTAAQAGCKPFPVGAHAVESTTVQGNAPPVRSGLRALPAPSRLNGMAQRQTRDSGAFTGRDKSASALASFKARTTCSAGTARPLTQSQRGMTLPRHSQITRSQFVKLPSHLGPVPFLLSDTAPRRRERTSLYAPTASSLAKARVRDAPVAVTTVPQTVRKSMQRSQASQGNS
ncbi:hypothetical protein QFC21_006286 [Naganishia friedmannii]|uniref:Uncharacterized protein n=1 Tax=Naganishia friedmannii TaxID=89922 RepID=A0ACC2V466_9TREE|nr:hypothetical protein QFC21_006286 [Naganishia friedmannii]